MAFSYRYTLPLPLSFYICFVRLCSWIGQSFAVSFSCVEQPWLAMVLALFSSLIPRRSTSTPTGNCIWSSLSQRNSCRIWKNKQSIPRTWPRYDCQRIRSGYILQCDYWVDIGVLWSIFYFGASLQRWRWSLLQWWDCSKQRIHVQTIKWRNYLAYLGNVFHHLACRVSECLSRNQVARPDCVLYNGISNFCPSCNPYSWCHSWQCRERNSVLRRRMAFSYSWKPTNMARRKYLSNM